MKTKKFNTIFWKKNHHGLLRSWQGPSRHQGLSEWHHWDNIKHHRREVQRFIGEYQLLIISPVLNWIFWYTLGRWKVQFFFTWEWSYRPDFHQVTFRSGFSRCTETRCINSISYSQLKNSKKYLIDHLNSKRKITPPALVDLMAYISLRSCNNAHLKVILIVRQIQEI